jgi:hypothetical protein
MMVASWFGKVKGGGVDDSSTGLGGATCALSSSVNPLGPATGFGLGEYSRSVSLEEERVLLVGLFLVVLVISVRAVSVNNVTDKIEE